jgi:hypothetical protein
MLMLLLLLLLLLSLDKEEEAEILSIVKRIACWTGVKSGENSCH